MMAFWILEISTIVSSFTRSNTSSAADVSHRHHAVCRAGVMKWLPFYYELFVQSLSFSAD